MDEKKQTAQSQEVVLPEKNTRTKKTVKKSKWRWLRRGICGLFIILLIPVLFLCTKFGQHRAIEWADKLIEPLRIGQVEGSIQDGLTINNAQFVTDGMIVRVGKADLRMGFDCLIYYKVCLNNLIVKDISVVIDTTKLSPSEEKNKSEPFNALNLPLDIAVKNVELENLDIKVDDTDIHLNHFQTAFFGKGKTISIHPTKLDGLDLLLSLKLDESDGTTKEDKQSPINAQEIVDQVVKESAAKTKEKVVKRFHELQGKSATKIEQGLNSKIDWVAIRAELEKPVLDKGSRFTLPLDLITEQINIANISISQKVRDEKGNFIEPLKVLDVDLVRFQMEAKDQQLTLKNVAFESDMILFTATGSLLLKDDYPLEWSLEGHEDKNAKVKLPFSYIKANISGELYNKTVLNVKTEGAIDATLEGNIELAKAKTPFDLLLKSNSMSYPFAPNKNEDVLKLENIDMHLKGDLFQYNLDAKISAKGMGIPASSATLKGNGELTNFQLKELELNTLGGKAQIVGLVDWMDGVEWDSHFTMNNINTKSLSADWPAILSGTLSSKGYAGKGSMGTAWKADVSNVDIKGSLFQKNLRLQGDLTAAPQPFLEMPSLSLIYGENKIDLKGVLGDKSDFHADIKAPNLQGLLPHLKAGIHGDVKLSGKVTEPNVDLDLTATNVSYDEFKLKNLIAKGKITTDKTIQGVLELDLRQFSYDDIKVDSATLSAKGNEENHTIKLTSKGNPIGADLQISGKFNRLQEVWEGELSQISLQSTDVGRLKTDKSVNVKYDNKTINTNISAHCWENPKINLCFPSTFNAGVEGKIPFDIRKFDLAVLQKYLDKDKQFSGVVNAKGEAAWFKNKQPEVNVELTSNSLKFVQKMDGGKNFPLTISPLKINLKIAENNLVLKSDLNVENNGKLSTDLIVKDLNKTRTLSGNINIEKLTLTPIRPLLSSSDSINGNINARLTVSGSASSPLLNGSLHLTGLKARSAIMPFDITGGNLEMSFHGATSTLNGIIQANQSELRLKGGADWRNLDTWKTEVQAQSNRFQVDIPNVAKVAINPNIQVIVTPTLLTLSGNVDIPWARIEVEELPESAVSISDDEIIMDGSSKAKIPLKQRNIPNQTPSGMAINADIKINIGNDVKLKAYGLNSNVNGLLSVRQGKQGLGLYGQVRLVEGRFPAYGQDLLIRRGNISFAGSPSQPILDIEAVRNPEAMEDPTITAGVRVSGLADNPMIKVFSNPAMSQNEALSYILTGRSLETSGDAGSSNAVAAALLSMNLSKSSKVVGDIGSAFGLKDLSVSTVGIGDNTKVEVSASLSPKFRVKYGVGIFAPLTELTLRYNLTPKLYLQWISNINQAVDLIYRFGFDSIF